MLGEDSQIKQMSQTIQGVLGSKFTYWNLDYSETEEYKYVEKLLRKINLDKLVTIASNSLFYGLAPFEILNKYDKEDKKIYIDLVYREPASINKFYYDDKPPYPIKSIEFIGRGVNNRAEKFNVDLDRLLIFTYNDDGGIINGESILKPIWKLYKIKKFLYKIMALGISRTAVPIPIGKVKTKLTQDKKANFENILKKLNAGDNASALIDINEWDIDEFGGKSYSFPYDKFIDLINKEMNKVMLLNVLSVGIDANAVFQTTMLEDVFYGKIWQIANNIADTINKEIIVPLVNANFSNPKTYPSLTIKKVGGRLGENIDARTLYMLSQYGLITPDEDMEQWLRSQCGLPMKKTEE
ncbi:MAG: hypothetical protein GYA14_04170 [Ignavibacteria bacterium]|nr:hypothetical protein [Ignavibacteria bacterium]